LDIKVADELWIACALLQKEKPNRNSFSNKEIIERVKAENIFGTLRPGIQVHLSTHCVANVSANPVKHRMLYKLADGSKRLFHLGDDYHSSRANGKLFPEASEIPEQYRYLLKWYEEKYDPNIMQIETPPIENPPKASVESVELSNEQQLLEFSYSCPSSSSGICKDCNCFIEEDEVKKAIKITLEQNGWKINKTAMGNTHGVDIAASKEPNIKLLIEAKGEGSLNPMRVNYFLGALGELLQKMDSPNNQYAIGLPAYTQFAKLIIRLPNWIKTHLRLKFYLVKKKSDNQYVVGHLAY
jgi:hypothetical protein